MEIDLQKVNKWYAIKINKKVKEFDDIDYYCAKVAFNYALELIKQHESLQKLNKNEHI